MKKTNYKYTWGGSRPGSGRKPEQFVAGATMSVSITMADRQLTNVLLPIVKRTDSTITASDGVTTVIVSVTQ